MFERFTAQARQAVVLAQEEAVSLGHHYIGTEHLLLGIAAGAGPGADVLQALGITRDAARERVTQLTARGPGKPAGHIPFTPQAKAALEQSLREALSLGHEHIGTEHLLLGVIEDPDGLAVRMLGELGVTPAQIRRQVIQQAPPGAPLPDPPPRARRIAGSARAGDIAAFLSSADNRLAAIDARLGVIDSRLAAIERHLGLEESEPPAPGPDSG